MHNETELYYYTFVFLSLFWILWRIKITNLGLLIIGLFWGGAVSYLGPNILNIYKISIVLYSTVLFFKCVQKKMWDHDVYVNWSFILFSVIFWISYILNGGGIITVLSQYLFKYGLIFLFYHGFKDISLNTPKREYIKNLLLQILYVQVFLSIIKILFFGLAFEHIVGSMSNGGAGIAVVIPVMALIFYWLVHWGKLTVRDWFIISSFFIIALASGKRAPVILFPVFALLIAGYVQKSIRLSQLIKMSPLLFLIIFFGVKLTPSLNPEGKIMGSFNPQHLINYSLNYNFGTTDFEKVYSDDYKTSGRGGSVFLLYQPDKIGLSTIDSRLFGKGLYESVTKEHGKFVGGSSYGIEHDSLVGEHIKIIFSLGYLGFTAMTLLAYFIISTVQNKRLRMIILLFFLWELFFYYNQVLFSQCSTIILLFICFYSNGLSAEWPNKDKSELLPLKNSYQ